MSIEFLTGDDAGPEPPAPRRSARTRWYWAVAAALALGAVVFALTRPQSGPAQPAAQTPAPVSRPPSAAPRSDPACAGVASCSVRSDVPVPIQRLARTYLPAGAQLQVHTVIGLDSLAQHDQLVQRDIVALVDSVSIHIRVQRGGSATQAIVPDPPGVGSLLLHAVNSGFVVRLQYLAPATVAPMADRLQALLRDPRLAAA